MHVDDSSKMFFIQASQLNWHPDAPATSRPPKPAIKVVLGLQQGLPYIYSLQDTEFDSISSLASNTTHLVT
jgi:hypothetical protein